MSHNQDHRAFTLFGWLVCVWVLVVSFQYGFHISSLNQIQAVLTCRTSDTSDAPSTYYGLPTCVPMTDATFSVLTSVYNVGGLLGSIGANLVMDRWGRKGAILVSSFLTATGSGFMGVAASLGPLIIGRLFTGIAAGLGICVGPIFLSEIAPANIKGTVGVLTQFAIVIGIMITQAMGLQLATPYRWRIVLLFSSALSIAGLLIAPAMAESPVWLARSGLRDEKEKTVRRLWVGSAVADVNDEDLEDPLLGESEDGSGDPHPPEEQRDAVTVPQALVAPDLRLPLAIICFSMLCQQLSGINAVLYYSNDILSKTLPDLGPYVSLGITVVNVFMTAAPIFLIDRLGRKTLLGLSSGGALISLFGVGIGLDSSAATLSSIAIVTFVASFAIGIGPVPFVMIPEVSPPHGVSALSSIGLSINWIANFSVGLLFLPLRNLLSGGDETKEGLVFFVFAALLAFFTFMLFRVYRG